MSNPEAAALIAENLDKLPDPDNADRHFMFIDYSRFPGEHEEHQQLKETNRQRTARGLVLMLENHGKTIVDTAAVTPPPTLGSRQVVSLHCAACGTGLCQTIEPIDQEGKLRVPSTIIPHECL